MENTEKLCEIKLTEKEQGIIGTILDFLKHSGLKTQPRIAGGWVRDKLLGLESNDIDIALDDIMGEKFVKLFFAYLKENSGKKSGGYGVMKSNPEKSKHLETATMKIEGQWIDFVNLRGEEYTKNDRIPTITMGTPEQDAYRRDLTINSLFYNIISREVEDHTKKGYEDLRNGIVRTPLPAKQTFLDDPLRILRAIRFASRFKFKIVPELLETLQNGEVKKMFVQKISKERIQMEVMKMLHHQNAFTAITYLFELDLISWIIIFPEKIPLGKIPFPTYLMIPIVDISEPKILVGKFQLGHLYCRLLNSAGLLNNCKTVFQYSGTDLKQKEIQYLMYMACVLAPFRGLELKVKKRMKRLVVIILTDLLKESRKVIQGIDNILGGVTQLLGILNQKIQVEEEMTHKLGFWIRNLKSL